jgi:hypothetical protein
MLGPLRLKEKLTACEQWHIKQRSSVSVYLLPRDDTDAKKKTI